MTPALRSLRLILSPYTPMLVTQEHVDWLNDKKLMRYSENRFFKHTQKTQLNYVGFDGEDRMLWLIRCEGVDIGTLVAHLDKQNNHANLGIMLGKQEYQGQGLAAEAWTAVIDYLFSEGLHKVECGCREDNQPMKRVAITTGMKLEAKIPGHFKVGNKYESLCVYGRFRADKHVSEWAQVLDAEAG